MKSANARRGVWSRWWLGAAGLGAFVGFAACGGADEHRDVRGGGDAGDSARPEPVAVAGAGAGISAGGSTAQGGTSPDVAGRAAGGATDSGGQAGGQAGAGAVDAGGAAGQSVGGAGGEAGMGGLGDAGGEGGRDPVADPVCGLGSVQVGAVSEWCGKVNVHLEQGSWVTDKDCTSGCRNDDKQRLAYCKKFYPKAASLARVSQAASGTKDWKNAGCADSYPDGPGISGEFACCAPAP